MDLPARNVRTCFFEKSNNICITYKTNHVRLKLSEKHVRTFLVGKLHQIMWTIVMFSHLYYNKYKTHSWQLYNLTLFIADPFAVDKSEQEGLIHIRIQQRNGRKTLTTVQGISDKYDKKRLVKYFKKVCSQTYLATWWLKSSGIRESKWPSYWSWAVWLSKAFMPRSPMKEARSCIQTLTSTLV